MPNGPSYTMTAAQLAGLAGLRQELRPDQIAKLAELKAKDEDRRARSGKALKEFVNARGKGTSYARACPTRASAYTAR